MNESDGCYNTKAQLMVLKVARCQQANGRRVSHFWIFSMRKKSFFSVTRGYFNELVLICERVGLTTDNMIDTRNNKTYVANEGAGA